MLSDSISARTIVLLLLYNSYIYCADGYVAAKLMCRLICNLRADGYVSTTLMCRLICNLPELKLMCRLISIARRATLL